MAIKNKVDEPTLEQLVMGANFRERDAVLKELANGIELILHPRNRTLYAGGGQGHFLTIPEAPKLALTRTGRPDPKTVDEKAQAAFQQELAAVTNRERELTALAQKARNLGDTWQKWGEALAVAEDQLLLSALDEVDRPEVESYLRQHYRFLRTVNSWVEKLRF